MPWYFFAFSAALLLASVAVLEKKVLFKEHATSFAATIAVLNGLLGLLLLPWVPFEALSGAVVFVIYIAAVIDALAFLFFIKSLRHLEVSYVAPMMAAGPMATAFLAFILLREMMTTSQVIGIGLLALGAVILQVRVSAHPFSARLLLPPKKYLHYVALALLFYGIGSLLDRVALAHYAVSPAAFVFFRNIFVAMNLLFIAILFYDGFSDVKAVLQRSWPVLFLAAALMLGERLFEAQAISVASIGLVVAIKRTSALFAALFGGELFHEKHFWLHVVSAVIMTAGVALVVL